uniref:Insect cytokine uENF2 n=2 Tax=Samia pryeri TaxID=3116429 RepID=E1CEG1_9NEOP|nr:insect cytokine precursor uENF2 [Samia cynthia pryeri]
MDAKFVLFSIVVMLWCMLFQAEAGVAFNFHDKISMSITTTTESNLLSGQVIRVPELECPLGQRRDSLGNCRNRL